MPQSDFEGTYSQVGKIVPLIHCRLPRTPVSYSEKNSRGQSKITLGHWLSSRDEVSVSPTTEGIRPPTKLLTEQHRKSEVPHHLVYKQRRRSAQTDWYDVHVFGDRCWKGKQWDWYLNQARGEQALEEAEEFTGRNTVNSTMTAGTIASRRKLPCTDCR